MSKRPHRRKQQKPDASARVAALIERARKNRASTLDLSAEYLTKLPESISQLTQLQSLNLSANQLTELPESIGQLTQLQNLDLANNQLTKLSESIGQLTQLQYLDLASNQLTEVPEFVSHLTQLRTLAVSSNQLTEVPESIGQLTQLQYLALSNNQLTEVPESIGQLAELKNLYLSLNQLTEVPEFVGQLAQLQILYLSYNQLTKLPESIGRLTQLQSLALSGNELTELPESISRLTQLESLDLSNNQLTEVPESIGQLTQLQSLALSNNQLTEVPESIGQLAELKNLYLDDNQLIGLRESLRNLNSLERLYLHGNDALDLPAEVLGASWRNHAETRANPAEILNYYFRVRGDGRRPLNEAKLILLGRGAVGKTSLVNRLVHHKFKLGEEKTEGIRITEWPLRLNGKEDVRLNVWDFGGQEIMHATHQFFLTQRSLYLLVLNGREGGEDADAEYWLKLIESFGDESPVIVVLNKIKEHAFDLNRRGLQQKYPFIRHFVKTDCEDKTVGLEELRRAIERETDGLENLRDAFPASWFQIKDQLPKMQKNYLSFDQYREVCTELGETDSTAQELLAVYLHRLGIALNYKDDARLQDTHVLNPRWVTDGIYKVLNSAKLERQQGVIRLDDLPDILDREEYPQGMHRFLLDLMRKFDLCFIFPDDDCRYLIPELLDKQESEATAEFESEECLNFQYHYPVLPEGLLPRFIVRTHALSENLPRWRTGVILTFEGNRALVKADVQDKKVFISVSGTAAGRRRLLAIIRSEFERIHRDIRNLQPQEMVPVPGRPNSVVAYKKLLVMEQGNVAEFPEVIGNEVINLSVKELLDGVDLEGTRRKERTPLSEQQQPAKLFYSYSHKDEGLRNELETHLTLLHRQGLIESWNDRDIEAGDEWRRKIDDNLERADIILLLVSADFIASDYCYEIEMRRALERHEKNEARVIPVILRDVNWRNAPFARLHALPKDLVAVTKWPDKDSAWRNVSEGIEKVASRIRQQHGRPRPGKH